MISINNIEIEVGHFPDKTQALLNFMESWGSWYQPGKVDIVWQYESDEELVTLYYIVNHIRDHMVNTLGNVDINLYMPYIPNARMDRTKCNTEILTLKYFCQLINNMKFNSVKVFDPHSNVSEALLDRLIIERPEKYLSEVRNAITKDTYLDAIYFPDDGAMKRYVKMIEQWPSIEVFYGKKNRDWKTGKILGLEIYNRNGELAKAEDLTGKHILMIDDIISYGGTLAYSADKLKELGAEKIFAYVSHCELSVLDPENGTFLKRLDNGTVNKLFTTNSIFPIVDAHEKIDVLRLPNTLIYRKDG